MTARTPVNCTCPRNTRKCPHHGRNYSPHRLRAIDVECPECGAAPGEHCSGVARALTVGAHGERSLAAGRAAIAEAEGRS